MRRQGTQQMPPSARCALALALALDSGAYEGKVRGTLATKRDDVQKKLDELRATLSPSAAQRAEQEATKELEAWQASRGGGAAAAVAAAPQKPERDAFKLAIEVLKAAAQHKAAVNRGDDSKRSDAVRLFSEGAALLAEAIASKLNWNSRCVRCDGPVATARTPTPAYALGAAAPARPEVGRRDLERPSMDPRALEPRRGGSNDIGARRSADRVSERRHFGSDARRDFWPGTPA